jgi:D-3-phosphoglycerate dehydrogenase
MSKTILLTHTPDMRRNYYGERALASLSALGPVRFHERDAPLAGASLIAAAEGCTIIVSDRQTPGDAEIFAALPDLGAFVRCAGTSRSRPPAPTACWSRTPAPASSPRSPNSSSAP